MVVDAFRGAGLSPDGIGDIPLEGLPYGLAGLAVVVAAGAITRRYPVPIAGVAYVAAGVAAVSTVRSIPGAVLAGLVALGAAGAIGHWIPGGLVPLLCLPGALLLATDGSLVEVGWFRVAVAAAIVLGGAGAARLDRGVGHLAVGPTMIGMTTAAAYLAVPDTEEIGLLLGVAAVLVLAGWPMRLGGLGAVGGPPAVGLLLWTAAVGARSRPASILGVVAALGLLALLPPMVATARRTRRARATGDLRTVAAASLVVHAVAALLGSRVAGLRDDALEAASLGLLFLVLAAVASAPVALRWPDPPLHVPVDPSLREG